jgi:hypothetical protein
MLIAILATFFMLICRLAYFETLKIEATRSYGVIFQRIGLFITTAVRT